MTTIAKIKHVVEDQFVSRSTTFMQVPSAGNFAELNEGMIAYQALSGRQANGLDYVKVVGNMPEGAWVGMLYRAIMKHWGEEETRNAVPAQPDHAPAQRFTKLASILEEFEKGCSNTNPQIGGSGKPEDCPACVRGMVNALQTFAKGS